ncbi:AAA family ATPase [Zooshikella marina]|uniref:ATP-binding protein n=1 Tax=Zooshikella ganghwensis TaxID=202772 RepID=A0A4P9VRE2_9GAMM|nr:AAA family ATPase [Zooshikella ganghwensis]MBU2706099.1 AAA family ATPase [Zooshikella ganghwensis]RDH46158.1 ATP-binding protein [Zooshikella ganghwensis]
MITTLAINNYRSILQLTTSLGALNVITGPNGSGKSNLYRALRLLAETAQGGVINSLAAEGGLESTFWAGPANITSQMKKGTVPVQGTVRKETVRLRLGFSTDMLSYSISLGLPKPSNSFFSLDPEIKRECIWAGPTFRPASLLVDRQGNVVKVRPQNKWEIATKTLGLFNSMFDEIIDPSAMPELYSIRESIRSWRFYDHFRTDKHSPIRQPQLGTRTPVLHHDGQDLAAALQTIREIGDHIALDEAVNDAFPGAQLRIIQHHDGRFSLQFSQEGLLRPLSGAELSDGTLRYILWIAALLTPRPPLLMVLNEPETSLHPDLLPALARLILKAADKTQVWVVTHSNRLISALSEHPDCNQIALEKQLGQTEIIGQHWLSEPAWHWPDKHR